MKVIGALKSTERTQRHTVEFPIPFHGAPNFKFSFEYAGVPEGLPAHGPVAAHAIVTGWRGQENVKAAWILVSIDGGSDLVPFRIHYEFEGDRGINVDDNA